MQRVERKMTIQTAITQVAITAKMKAARKMQVQSRHIANMILYPAKELLCLKISCRMQLEIFLLNGTPMLLVKL